MASIFNPKQHENSVESKIIFALERLSQSFRVQLWNQTKNFGVSPIQIQLMIFMQHHPKEMCTVSYLAQEFNMTKPTISDSISTLLKKGFVEKTFKSNDKRTFQLSLNEEGKEIVRQTENFTQIYQNTLSDLTVWQKELIFKSLLEMMKALNKNEVLSMQRSCHSCSNFTVQYGRNMCTYKDIQLQDKDIQIDCSVHNKKINVN